MADRLDLNPTRGNLLRLKKELESLRSSHELLDRKREVLIQELMKRSEEAGRLEEKLHALFQKAHEAIRTARVDGGSDRLEAAAMGPAAAAGVEVAFSTVMGVKIPKVTVSIDDGEFPYGPSGTGPALDDARGKWIDALRFLAAASESSASLNRLAADLKKTRRQVNALQSIIIPRHENTISYIEERLDEEEREDILHAKKIGK